MGTLKIVSMILFACLDLIRFRFTFSHNLIFFQGSANTVYLLIYILTIILYTYLLLLNYLHSVTHRQIRAK